MSEKKDKKNISERAHRFFPKWSDDVALDFSFGDDEPKDNDKPSAKESDEPKAESKPSKEAFMKALKRFKKDSKGGDQK